MTRLLVSVQDADEAQVALDAGADVIDVKDPHGGSLGAPPASTVREVMARMDGRRPVSVACGELLEWSALQHLPVVPGIGYAKFGLAGCAPLQDWPTLWADALECLPARTASVAVVYADGAKVNAPRPQEVLRHAVTLGCRVVLIDTCDKSAGCLLEHWSVAELDGVLRDIQSAGLQTAVAGSLEIETLMHVLPLSPDYVAVRGAVSRPARTGRINRRLVEQLVRQIRGRSLPPAAEPTSATRQTLT